MRVRFQLILPLLLIGMIGAHGQAGLKDDIVLKAMQDELKRGMTDLKLADFDRPFFMMYGVSDYKINSIVGSMGSLVQSSENKFRDSFTSRLLVGSYEFNDESLDDDITTNATARAIDIPIDDDYDGIRRSLWSHTDKIYKDAAKHYSRNKESLKETGKQLKDIPHRTFVRTTPDTLIAFEPVVELNKQEWEQKARRLSALFTSNKNILNSTVAIVVTDGLWKLVNSEGTIGKVSFRQASFVAMIQTKNEKGEFNVDYVMHITTSPSKFPTEAQLASEINSMIAKIDLYKEAPVLEDDYNGPVLFMGQSVAEILSTAVLATGKESMMDSDEIPQLTGLHFSKSVNSMDSKIGKGIVNESLSIKVKAKQKTFKGTDLLGSFAMDNEGAVPEDEVVLVDKGILKGLLNNRTQIDSIKMHSGFVSGPGVVEVSSTQKYSEKDLKNKLMEQAKNKGLAYGVLVRNFTTGNTRFTNIYQVNVKDGTEKLVRNASISPLTFRDLKKSVSASGNYEAYNMPMTGRGRANIVASGIVSFIVPDGLLLEELEISPMSLPTLKEEEYISSPIK